MRAQKWRILCALALSALLLVLPAVCATQERAPLTTVADHGSAALRSQEEGRFKLSPNALQVGRIIGVDPAIARLSELTTAKNRSAGPDTALQELSLRQQITDTVVEASLDMDSVLDELDSERDQIVELRSILRARRDRASGTQNAATFALGTGLGVVSGLLSFSKITSSAGNAVGFAAGGISSLRLRTHQIGGYPIQRG